MAWTTDPTTAAELAGSADQTTQLNILAAALGSGNKTLTVKHAVSGSPRDGTTVYMATLDSSMTVSAGKLKFGAVIAQGVALATDMSVGSAILIVSNSSGRYAEGPLTVGGPDGFYIPFSPSGLFGIPLDPNFGFSADPSLPAAPVRDLEANFKLSNWSATPTKAYLRAGMPFKKGDIPAGMCPEVRTGGVPVVAQFDERSTWDDGSLRFAVCHLRDADLPGSAEREYQIFVVKGDYDNTGATTLASVVSANALTVELSGFKLYTGVTNNAGQGSSSNSKPVYISDVFTQDTSAEVRLNISGNATGYVQYSTNAGASWSTWPAGTVGVTTTWTVTQAMLIRTFGVSVPNGTSINSEVLPQTRKTGAALASLVSHAAVPTRATKVHSGPVCEGWTVWGMSKEGAAGAGAEDDHLKAIWHIDVWKDAAGSIVDTEFGAEMAQDWWGVANKFRLDYSATLKRNGATVQAYVGIQQPYGGHWLTVRMQDDNNHAKRHRVGAVPTLTYMPSRDYWKQTRLVPPYDTTNAATANASITYVPCASMEHRADIDSTGGYLGRGMLPNCDGKTFIRQTPVDYRNSRTNAFAGLHVPYHFRDERARTRPSETADVANTLVPLLWDPKPASASTFIGLPVPKNAYAGGAASIGDKGGFESPLGGMGVWSTATGDASHAVAYSAFAYLVEGERYFLDASVSLAHHHVQARNGNEFGGKPYVHWYMNTAARTEMSIPSTRWGAITDLNGQERALGFSINLMGYASALSPDADPQGQYIKGLNLHNAEYLAAAVRYTPTAVRAAGGIRDYMRSPWMTAFNIQGCSNNFLMTGSQGCYDYGDMLVRFTVAVATRNKYDLLMYRSLQSTTPQEYNGSNYLPAAKYLSGPETITASAGILTFGSETLLPQPLKDGDLIYFYAVNDSSNAVALPSGYTGGTPLYVINTSGVNFQVSLTVGGAVFAVSNGTYRIAGEYSGRADIAVAANPPYLPSGDSYPTIHEAAFAFAEVAGFPSAPAGTFAVVRAHLANVNRTTDPRWTLTV